MLDGDRGEFAPLHVTLGHLLHCKRVSIGAGEELDLETLLADALSYKSKHFGLLLGTLVFSLHLGDL